MVTRLFCPYKIPLQAITIYIRLFKENVLMNYTKNQWQQAVDQWSRIVELYEDAREDCNKWMDHHFNSHVDLSNGAVRKWGLNLSEEHHGELCRLENRLRLISMQRGYAWELVDLYRRLERSIYSVPALEEEVEEEDVCMIAWAR